MIASDPFICAHPSSLALEEELDRVDPLRHLMREGSDTSSADDHVSIIPKQISSIHDETLQLSFVPPGSDPIVITLMVDASPGCGGVAWPAGQVLSNYLVQKGPRFLEGRNILELGSGTGLVGLVAGKLGGNVCITDQAPLLEIMHRNIVNNNLSVNVTVSQLDWGSPINAQIARPHLILAADCVYFEPAFPLLVQTLSDLATSTTEILFCYKKRRKADKRFFIMLRKKFSWVEVLDSADRESYSRDSISLLRLVKI
ncbi:putative methyltransferase-domain-containing protein [Infundibulicybe gibba]|nr:putative methyltransferase-domain-containing protein [Infundibulicybe gibba]